MATTLILTDNANVPIATITCINSGILSSVYAALKSLILTHVDNSIVASISSPLSTARIRIILT